MLAVLYTRPAAAVGHIRPLAWQLHSSPDVTAMLITVAQQCLFPPGQLVPVIDTMKTSMAKSKGTYSSPVCRSMPHVTALQQQQQQQQPPPAAPYLSGFSAQGCRGCGRRSPLWRDASAAGHSHASAGDAVAVAGSLAQAARRGVAALTVAQATQAGVGVWTARRRDGPRQPSPSQSLAKSGAGAAHDSDW